MDFAMDAVAQVMSMKSAELQQSASAALMKRTMNTEEMAAAELLEMLPEQTAVQQIPKGTVLDVYA